MLVKILTHLARAIFVFAAIVSLQSENLEAAYNRIFSGNLAFDGAYVYQYDAWNRLVQANVAGAVPANWDGKVTSAAQLGALVCRFTYDGFGRMIRKETPVSEGMTGLQRKDMYYDGVRRIQEVIERPSLLEQLGGAGFVGDPGAGNDEQPVELATSQPGGDPVAQTLVSNLLLPPGDHWTDREYVYGPDYVDEFVCQLPYG